MIDKPTKIFVGKLPIHVEEKKIQGALVDFKGESYYRISNYDQMPPFFMSLTSDSDVWMFISSNGGLSAGRKDAEHAIFPYYTDDKIVESAEITGSKSIFLIKGDEKDHVWEPFSIRAAWSPTGQPWPRPLNEIIPTSKPCC